MLDECRSPRTATVDLGFPLRAYQQPEGWTPTESAIMSGNPYESPDTIGEPPPRKTGALGRRLVELLSVIAVIGILLAMLLPNVRGAREPARRMQCSNNLKQIGLALHNYHDEYGAFPPAYTVDEDGTPLHSWRTLILPYLEQKSLYEKLDLSKPWDDPANEEAYETPIDAYHCPSAILPPTHTTYLAVVAPNGCFSPTGSRRFSEITDENGLTLMVVDVDAKRHVHWMSPKDIGEGWIVNLRTVEGLSHPGGMQAVRVDGSVRFVSSEASPAALRALVSIDGDDDDIAQEAD
jgi:type II secretory pathway pseudopilin PulG